MLSERKPSERFKSEIVSPWDILDEHHATLTEHARAIAGTAVKGAPGSEGDALEMLCEMKLKGIDGDAAIDAVISALEAEHGEHARLVGNLRSDINDLQSALESANANAEELLRQRDEARDNYRFMVEKAADQKLDGYRELGDRAAKAENERDELLRAAGINPGSNHEGAMAQLRDMRVSLREAQANCDAAERGMRALLDSEGPGQAIIGARVTHVSERCDGHDCIAPARHEIVNRGQHVAHFCDTHWLRLDARLGDIAALVKDGCHPDIAAARVGNGIVEYGSNDDPLVILRELLHDGWDDDTLRELRSVIASLRNERNSSAAELTAARLLAECNEQTIAGLDSKLTAIRVALTNAGVPEVEDYPEDPSIDDYERSLRTGGRSLGYVERIGRLIAERDTARRERDESNAFAAAETEHANKWNKLYVEAIADRDRLQAELDGAKSREAETAAGSVKLLAELTRLRDENESLRAQSSEGLREAIAGFAAQVSNSHIRERLNELLAAHPAPSANVASDLIATLESRLESFEEREPDARKVAEWAATVAMRASDIQAAARRYLTGAPSPTASGATAEIPGVEWDETHTAILADGELELYVIDSEQIEVLDRCQERAPILSRSQVRDTLIPLLTRFVGTGKLTGGVNG